MHTKRYVNDSGLRTLSAPPMPHRPLTRAERKHETRVAVIDAAAQLFARKGIEATSIDAIATSLGLTKGAVYASFGSKHELIKAVAKQYSAAADVGPLLRPDLPLAERLRLFGRGVYASLQGTSRLQVLLDFESAVYAMRNKRWARLIHDTSGAGIRDLAARFHEVNVARGERPPLDGEAFFTALTVVVRGVVQQFALDPTALREPALETLFALLAGESSASGQKSPRRRGARGQ